MQADRPGRQAGKQTGQAGRQAGRQAGIFCSWSVFKITTTTFFVLADYGRFDFGASLSDVQQGGTLQYMSSRK